MEITWELVGQAFFGWVVLAIFAKPISRIAWAISEFLSVAFYAAADGLKGAINPLMRGADALAQYASNFFSAVAQILQRIVLALQVPIRAMHNHAAGVISIVSQEPQLRGWRIAGALLYLSLISLFLYADLAQGLNNLSLVMPVQVPEFLQELAIPVVISSAGTMVALGIISVDFMGKTEFSPWSTFAGKTRRLFAALIGFTFLVTLTLSMLLAFGRVPELFNLPSEIEQTLRFLTVVAQSAVLLPLLITTFLLWWGAMGLLVLYACLVALVWGAFALVRFVVDVLRVSSPLVGNGAAAVITVVSRGFGGLLGFLSWGFETLGELATGAARLVTGVVFGLVQPLWALAAWVREILRGNHTLGRREAASLAATPGTTREQDDSGGPLDLPPQPAGEITDTELARGLHECLSPGVPVEREELKRQVVKTLGIEDSARVRAKLNTIIQRESQDGRLVYNSRTRMVSLPSGFDFGPVGANGRV